ncbi:hypothetical protein L226DRAFT_562729 [Lentinus tigrinus ALCF2SS1-7]|uniref:Protein kinase domain-containing protein n=1 Tax=Lentinus tigrinus ALCF2SS1-6 TaxID=1328759 RepID=A0A5C2RVY0_9APHY|nr:hypothetical protein L227DRAFT_603492 [Lentinus tigrinus ALCF2SS1-6]RPD70725.1 hypothetical protein L226DRAFT_562729 [Lentinus tigrinus ALCF2SS1-7]
MLYLTILSDTQLLLQTPGPADACTSVLEAPHANTENYRFSKVTEEISARDDPEREDDRPNGDMLRVFRGTMLKESTHEELRVVFKIAYDEECLQLLAHEAEFYATHLAPVQGRSVPRMYGSFVGETDEGRTRVTVLEDWGEQLRVALMMQPVKFRKEIVRAFVDIHQVTGVVHNDFNERHVVVKTTPEGYWPVIVDFTMAELHPDIPCMIELPIEVYSDAPDQQLVCGELWEVIMEEAQLWRPSVVDYFGVKVPIDEAKDPANLVKYAPRWVDSTSSEADKLRHAKIVLRELVKWVRQRQRWDRNAARIH